MGPARTGSVHRTGQRGGRSQRRFGHSNRALFIAASRDHQRGLKVPQRQSRHDAPARHTIRRPGASPGNQRLGATGTGGLAAGSGKGDAAGCRSCRLWFLAFFGFSYPPRLGRRGSPAEVQRSPGLGSTVVEGGGGRNRRDVDDLPPGNGLTGWNLFSV